MSKGKGINYPGKDANVTWHGRLCIHIGECGRARGDLFVGGRQPWCDPDQSTETEVTDVVLRCPTGALSAQLADGTNPETKPDTNTVNVAYNGPLFVRGDLDIEGAPDDAPGLKCRAALCRCGQSKNKPFCDNSHEEAGFKDFGAVGETGDVEFEPGGTLSIKGAKDGPLLLNGSFTIFASSGRPTWTGKRVALCRCGESGNKPFCDGAHKAAGFKSD